MIEKRKVTVILLPGEEGSYAAFIPLFPSCTTGGNTAQEALDNAKECLELALDKPTADDLEFLGYLDMDHVVVGRIEVEVPVQMPPSQSFEEVWQILTAQLEGKIIPTLVQKSRNRIVSFETSKMIRQTQTDDAKGWKVAQPVPRSAFERIWEHLSTSTDGVLEVKDVPGWKYIVAACLVHAKLGVTMIQDRPLTLRLRPWPRVQ